MYLMTWNRNLFGNTSTLYVILPQPYQTTCNKIKKFFILDLGDPQVRNRRSGPPLPVTQKASFCTRSGMYTLPYSCYPNALLSLSTYHINRHHYILRWYRLDIISRQRNRILVLNSTNSTVYLYSFSHLPCGYKTPSPFQGHDMSCKSSKRPVYF